MSKHTPGEWAVSEALSVDHLHVKNQETGREWYHSSRAIFAGDMVIARVEVNISSTVGGYPTPQSHEELLANARLIAQAPRLLEALEALVAYDECDDDVDSMFAYAECLKLARAAIEATKGNDNG